MKKFDNVYVKRFLYFNIFVIKGKNGDILIDTGFIGMRKYLKKWLDNFNIKLIILTHAHVDHIWNVSYLKDLYNCEVAIGKNDYINLDNSIINTKGKKKIYNLWAKLMNFGMKKFVPEVFDIDYFLEDKQVFKKYGINLEIFNLEGHTEGSIGIKYKDYLFVGDALVNRKLRFVEVAFQNQDNDMAKESFYKIIDLKPDIIFVGHDKEISYSKLLNSIDYNK